MANLGVSQTDYKSEGLQYYRFDKSEAKLDLKYS